MYKCLMSESEFDFSNITEDGKNIMYLCSLWLNLDIVLQVQGCGCISMDAVFMQS